MISILKSDITWYPEQINDTKYLLRSNKSFFVAAKDFIDYDTGINLNFSESKFILFKLHGLKSAMELASPVLKKSNINNSKSTILRIMNKTSEDIHVKETEYLLSFELIEKDQELSQCQPKMEAEAQAEAEPEPQAKAEPEPQAEAEPEPQAEAEPEPQAEAEPEPQVEAEPEPQVEAPKKRKYVKRK